MTDAYVALSGPPSWHEAACRGHDPELWFADEKDNASRRMRDEAKAVCAGCRHIAECLTFAIDTDIRYGIFGGRTANERRKPRRRADRGQRTWRRKRSEIPTRDATCEYCRQTYAKPVSQPNQMYCGHACYLAAHNLKRAARLSRQGAA